MNFIDKFLNQNIIPKIRELSTKDKKAFAEHIDVTVRTVDYWIKNGRFTKKANIEKVIEFLGLPKVAIIFEGSDSKPLAQFGHIKNIEDKLEGLEEKNILLKELKEFLNKKIKDLEDENNLLKIQMKNLIESFVGILKETGPPEGMVERRQCREEFKKFFKEIDIKTT